MVKELNNAVAECLNVFLVLLRKVFAVLVYIEVELQQLYDLILVPFDFDADQVLFFDGGLHWHRLAFFGGVLEDVVVH